MSKNGRFTLPGEKGMEHIIPSLVERWGVDAVRDSDGTHLSQEILDMGLQVYSTLCLIREGNKWIKTHPQCRQQIYLCTPYITAFEHHLIIPIMDGYFDQQFEPNTDVDIKRYWQVMDRTEGTEVCPEDWSYDGGIVTIANAKKYHTYTVSFLVYQIWEPVSMYNHLTNNWDEEHKIPIDIRHPEAQDFVMERLESWLKDHEKTDVVRFTTFFYNFDLVYNEKGKEKRVDWFGYTSCVSEKAIQDFQQDYGYQLTPEDFIDGGRYHTPFHNPTKKYRAWMEFNQKFVAKHAKKCVDLVHAYGKKAIMFLGDHWSGTEPYGTYFPEIGLDAVVGAAGDGVTTRMIADIPVKETEARFYPYFFPDTFYKGGDPVGASKPIWIRCRRGLMLSPTQRMGYGGYLSLAVQFPEFVEHVSQIAKQFRLIHDETKGTKARSASFKIGVLNSWGKLRSWMTHQVAHSLWNQRCYSYLGIMEALAGLPFDIEFLSFDDIKNNGISKDIGVLINAGDAGTSWSGGKHWDDSLVITTIRKWVAEGGGFIGVGEPTAYEKQGKLFQLEDVLGVQKEMGFTAGTNKMPMVKLEEHFITADLQKAMDYGEGMTMITPVSPRIQVIDIQDDSCALSAHRYQNGRAVYIAGLPFNIDNTRILHRALYWAAQKEEELTQCFSENPCVEIFEYPEVDKICVINNSDQEQMTVIYRKGKVVSSMRLMALEMVWT